MAREGERNSKWKGGRNLRLSVKVTDAVKSRLRALAGRRGETMSDTIEYLIVSEHRMMVMEDYEPLPTPPMAPLQGDE